MWAPPGNRRLLPGVRARRQEKSWLGKNSLNSIHLNLGYEIVRNWRAHQAMKDGEIRETLRAILERLLDGYAPSKVIFFGSYVDGTPRTDSDIDLLIVKETKERFIDRWVTVQKLLTGVHGTHPVDTLVLTPLEIEGRLAAGDQFIHEIINRGEVLYGGA